MNAEETLEALKDRLTKDYDMFQKRHHDFVKDESTTRAIKLEGMMNQAILTIQWINSHYTPTAKLSEISQNMMKVHES